LRLVIKLQRYEDALIDCNTVLTMDYRNIKALLRRALSLEHLEKSHEVKKLHVLIYNPHLVAK